MHDQQNFKKRMVEYLVKNKLEGMLKKVAYFR